VHLPTTGLLVRELDRLFEALEQPHGRLTRVRIQRIDQARRG
jgi:hypothetical protein